MNSQERRQNTRVRLDAPVTICSHYMIFNSNTVDISLGGTLVDKPDRWYGDCGDQFELLIASRGNSNQIQMKASVRHINDHSLGFFCDHIDAESYTQLRQLIAEKLGDISHVNKELVELI